jgi:hypothetical protein
VVRWSLSVNQSVVDSQLTTNLDRSFSIWLWYGSQENQQHSKMSKSWAERFPLTVNKCIAEFFTVQEGATTRQVAKAFQGLSLRSSAPTPLATRNLHTLWQTPNFHPMGPVLICADDFADDCMLIQEILRDEKVRVLLHVVRCGNLSASMLYKMVEHRFLPLRGLLVEVLLTDTADLAGILEQMKDLRWIIIRKKRTTRHATEARAFPATGTKLTLSRCVSLSLERTMATSLETFQTAELPLLQELRLTHWPGQRLSGVPSVQLLEIKDPSHPHMAPEPGISLNIPARGTTLGATFQTLRTLHVGNNHDISSMGTVLELALTQMPHLARLQITTATDVVCTYTPGQTSNKKGNNTWDYFRISAEEVDIHWIPNSHDLEVLAVCIPIRTLLAVQGAGVHGGVAKFSFDVVRVTVNGEDDQIIDSYALSPGVLGACKTHLKKIGCDITAMFGRKSEFTTAHRRDLWGGDGPFTRYDPEVLRVSRVRSTRTATDPCLLSGIPAPASCVLASFLTQRGAIAVRNTSKATQLVPLFIHGPLRPDQATLRGVNQHHNLDWVGGQVRVPEGDPNMAQAVLASVFLEPGHPFRSLRMVSLEGLSVTHTVELLHQTEQTLQGLRVVDLYLDGPSPLEAIGTMLSRLDPLVSISFPGDLRVGRRDEGKAFVQADDLKIAWTQEAVTWPLCETLELGEMLGQLLFRDPHKVPVTTKLRRARGRYWPLTTTGPSFSLESFGLPQAVDYMPGWLDHLHTIHVHTTATVSNNTPDMVQRLLERSVLLMPALERLWLVAPNLSIHSEVKSRSNIDRGKKEPLQYCRIQAKELDVRTIPPSLEILLVASIVTTRTMQALLHRKDIFHSCVLQGIPRPDQVNRFAPVTTESKGVGSKRKRLVDDDSFREFLQKLNASRCFRVIYAEDCAQRSLESQATNWVFQAPLGYPCGWVAQDFFHTGKAREPASPVVPMNPEKSESKNK